MRIIIATAAIALMAWPALAQTNRNKSNEGIQSPTQQQRLDNGTIIPHGATGSDTTNLGGRGSGSNPGPTQGLAPPPRGGAEGEALEKKEAPRR
jgi:hypothetical protein